jgi:hypothetical protein
MAKGEKRGKEKREKVKGKLARLLPPHQRREVLW